jgi:hypothetical protein
MPFLITFSTGTDDSWLRAMIRAYPNVVLVKHHRVIVQDIWEARLVTRELHNLKIQRGRPYGGSMYEIVK